MDVNTSCFKIEAKFPLDFITDYRDSDEKLLLESIKNFKNPDYKPTNIQFLEGREIRILAEFYARYGESIRQTDNFGCEKIEGKFCICFINEANETDISAINQAIRVYRGESSREGFFVLFRDRELLILAEFFSRYGSQLRN